ncbi:MAG: ATP-dependent Clp protease adaptor ClpS [Chlorobium sp.]|jgi:ATP-dependent Clp protease adapter protein ClpS|nr:ATP-dependent Clp protease adaptor ClpS [Chlorobium sp.]
MNSTPAQQRATALPVIETKKSEQNCGTELLDAYRVVLFNDEVHTFDDVISQIMKAIRCSRHQAEKHTWQVHTLGRSIVYAGTMFHCLQVSSILEEIALRTEIQTA